MSSVPPSPSASNSLRIDISLASADVSRHLGRVALPEAKSQPDPEDFPSVLAMARVIEDIRSVQYPEGVKCPKPGLNVNAKQSQFLYDRDFLLQFRGICKERPDSLVCPDQINPTIHGGSHTRRSSAKAMPSPSRQATVGLSLAESIKPSVDPSTMGQFSTPSQKMESGDRFTTPTQSPPVSGGSKRRRKRGDHAQVSSGGAARPSSKATGLSKFGKIDKTAAMTFGPSSVFQKGNMSNSRESTVRQGSSSMISMLHGNPKIGPSTVRLDGKADEGPSGTPSVPSEADAKARVEEDSKEFFSIRDVEEAKVYFMKLPSEHRHLLVNKLVIKAVESRQADAQLVADLFNCVATRKLCSPTTFEEGFTPIAEIIDDIVIDAPKAMELFAIVIKGSRLHLDEERRARLANKSIDSDKLIALLS